MLRVGNFRVVCNLNSSRSHKVLALVLSLPFLWISLNAQSTSYDLFVSSRNTHSVKRFNGQTGAYIAPDFVQAGSGGLSFTQEVAFGPDGNLYVSGRGNTHILKFDGTTGAFLGNFSSGYTLDNPTKMTFGPDGNVYISQWGTAQNKVARFNAATGVFVDEFTSVGLFACGGHSWDSLENLYVANYGNGGNGNVQEFDINGQFVRVFTAAGHLNGPINVWFGDGGDLFVVDWTRGAVVRFDGVTGAYKSDFITGLQNAEGVTFGPDSLIYICDWTANQIKRYSRSGMFIGVLASGGGLLAPNSLVFHRSSSTSVEPENNGHPGTFKLNQNYPNPFNPSTNITYDIIHEGFVSLAVYDVAGGLIATLVHSGRTPGSYEVPFSIGNELSSGVYFYRMSQNNVTATRKMMLLK